MIADVICKAESAHEVYFLLTSYTEALQFSDIANIPPKLLSLPFGGQNDIQFRFMEFLGELDQASRRLDDKSCLTIKEALHVFGAALARLQTIEKKLPALGGGDATIRSAATLPSVARNPYEQSF